MTISLATKRQWFDRGVRAFSEAAPTHLGQGYCCPICLGISPLLTTFTVEDVPPQSVGGRPLLLTCERCNSSSGATLDWHWDNFSDLEGFAAGDPLGPVTVNFTYQGFKVVGEVSNEGSGYQIKLVAAASNPTVMKQLEDLVRETIDTGGQPQPMNMGLYKSKFNERLLRLSVLRAAYLTGVAVAGYRMIPLWNSIRLQILDPDQTDPSLSALVRYENAHPRNRRAFGEINQPNDMKSFCIGFGRWTAFLPLERESLLYRPTELSGKFEFRGTSYEWPSEPSFGIAS